MKWRAVDAKLLLDLGKMAVYSSYILFLYPIPRAIRLYLQGVAEAIIDARMAGVRPSGDDEFVEVEASAAQATAETEQQPE